MARHSHSGHVRGPPGLRGLDEPVRLLGLDEVGRRRPHRPGAAGDELLHEVGRLGAGGAADLERTDPSAALGEPSTSWANGGTSRAAFCSANWSWTSRRRGPRSRSGSATTDTPTLVVGIRPGVVPEADAAPRQPESLRAADYPVQHVGSDDRRRRCRVTAPEVSWGHSGERAGRGRVASRGPTVTVGWSVFPSLGLAVRSARGHAALSVAAGGEPEPSGGSGRGGSGASGWRWGSRCADRTDAGAEARGPGVPSAWERPLVAVRSGALDRGLSGGRVPGVRAGPADVVSHRAGRALRG